MRSRTEAPTLSSASVRAGGVAAVRLLLGVVFVAGATLRGLGGGPAVIATLAGALLLAVIALGQRSRAAAAGFGEALPVPPDARFDSGWIGILLACIPSTIGVSVMAIVSLVVSPPLAAVLGGVLIALGALAAVSWAQVAARERREETSYWIERGPRPRLFGLPHGARGVGGTTGPGARPTEAERTD